MKFKGLLALALVGSMSTANATVARLQALGMTETDNEGSYFIEDDRNILLNVANVNSYGDTLILELGGNGSAATGNSQLTTDQDYSAKAKGGVFKKHGEMTYGIYLGGESNTSSLLRAVGSNSAAANLLDSADNQVELFLGSKAGFGDWGVSVVYTADNFNDGTDRGKDVAHAVKFGVKNEKWHALANISTGTYVERVNAGDVNYFDGKLGLHLGGGYKVNDHGTVYGFMKKFDWEQYALSFDPDTVEGGFLTYGLGYGAEYTNGKGTFLSSIEYRHKEVHADFSTKVEAKNVILPVMVGYEYKATEWLTLRGSVTQQIYGYRENTAYTPLNAVAQGFATGEFGASTAGKKVTIPNTTDVRAGASLNFGRLRIDGLLGLGGTNGQIATSAVQRANKENGVLDMDRLLARVGMVYSF